MNIDYPSPDQLDGLQALWQEAFGDDDAFVEQFYTYGFAPDRCRCLTVDGQIAAALYWFDCSYQGKPLAYLYGPCISCLEASSRELLTPMKSVMPSPPKCAAEIPTSRSISSVTRVSVR